MSSVSDAGGERVWRRSGSCGRMGWTPLELLAMVLGFATYWPIGLGVIAWKMMQRRGSVGGFDWDAFRTMFAGAGPANTPGTRPDWNAWGAAASGNAAFDAWRTAEIERLDAERRKLDEARRAFSAFAEQARQARDKEEFERFMANRPS